MPDATTTPALMTELAAALARHDRAAVNDVIGRLVHGEARLADRWRGLAAVLVRNGELNLARRAMRLYLNQSPPGPARSFEHALFLAEIGDLASARALLQNEARNAPALPRAHMLGTILSQLGETAAAIACFREAIGMRPEAGASWLGLAGLIRFRADAPDLAAMRALQPAMRAATPADRAPYLFALGKALDDIGEVDAAFAAVAEGAALVHAQRKWDGAESRAAVARIIAGDTLSGQTPPAARPSTRAGDPIFVLGLPRSGTTLVEQILVSHSAVADGGEVNLIRHVAEEVGGPAAAHLAAHLERAPDPIQEAERLRSLYRHLLRERFGSDARVVDKSLNNSRFLGMIATLLPDAPLIWLRRDPLDTAWSCFRTLFSTGVPWSFSLTDIADHFAIEERLFRHWRATLGPRLLVVPYAELVADTALWTSRIAAHCGLAVEEGMFSFHQTRRAVATSSAAQVRTPLYRHAIGSARPYRTHLEPFLTRYEAADRRV